MEKKYDALGREISIGDLVSIVDLNKHLASSVVVDISKSYIKYAFLKRRSGSTWDNITFDDLKDKSTLEIDLDFTFKCFRYDEKCIILRKKFMYV